ncbi:MAG: alpha-amylase family protein [Terracidiphilus sp.]
MSQAEFDKHMPHEFWREVVDRVAAEVPGTLLLAEAFWLMEGYFVRTLGMHRVYNSAFMVMLRDEDNAKYRSVIKNTLEFDPEVMKRYVNFMSNPDERTAIDQFGKGDKCFGVAALMATLPGLPMFGHGQIEGFTEKYGMEYQCPRYDETPDHWLVERHLREIAPLLHRRSLFAESSNFLLYDFYQSSGSVDENVFAYSNRNGSERALVVYNNRYGETHGTIDISAAYADKDAAQLRQRRLREGLGLSDDTSAIFAFRDSLTGLEYLRRADGLSERGLTLGLHAYQCHVFLDWRELYATATQPWDRLCDQLNGGGVPSLGDALINLELRPVHEALRLQLDPDLVRLFADLAEHPRTLAAGPKATETDKMIELSRSQFYEQAWQRCEAFLRLAQSAYVSLAPAPRSGLPNSAQPKSVMLTNPVLLGPAFRERLRAAMRLPAIEALFPTPWPAAARRVLPSPSPQFTATAMWGPVLAWSILELLAESIDAEHPESVALDLFDRLRLREPFAQSFTALGFEAEASWRVAARIKVVLLTGSGIGRESAPVPRPASGVSPHAAQFDLGAALYQGATGRGGLQPTHLSPAANRITPEPGSSTSGKPAVRPAIPPALWSDPDVRWLTGTHQAQGHDYFLSEAYEELLWWLHLPSLLRVAPEPAPARAVVAQIHADIHQALSAAEAAGYRIDVLLAPPTPPTPATDSLVEEEEPEAARPQAESPTTDPGIELPTADPEPPLPALPPGGRERE